MTKLQSSYRQIMKATSIFGGVQVFNILISIIRSKFIAVLLGPSGMGIIGLLTSATGLISGMTNFGLGTSAVKDIAAANETGNSQRIALVVRVYRRLIWVTGIIGTLATLLLSSWLSQITFGNRDYTIAFIWISITLLINQLTSGQLVILQGMRKLKNLAKANLFGSILGLIITLLLYFYWGVKGIVPGIIASSVITLLLSWIFARKLEFQAIHIPLENTFTEGKFMLRMGFFISLSSLLSVGIAYLIRIFISQISSVEQVGLYNAGFAIIYTYFGLVFNAMGTDYYPRLSAVAHNDEHCKDTINKQIEIALLIISPMLIIFLVFINWIIILLYSKTFVGINDMIHWAALGMFFKISSWSIAYIFLAKGDSKLFFILELNANLLLLAMNMGGYYYGGLTGLGISFTFYNPIYLFIVYQISKKKYTFSFHSSTIKIFSIQFGLALCGFLAVKLLVQPLNFFVGISIIIYSVIHSVKELDKKLGLISFMKGFYNNYK